MIDQNIKDFIDWKAKHGEFKHVDWSKPLSFYRKKKNRFSLKKKISLNFSNEDFFFKWDRYKEKLNDQSSFLYYFDKVYQNNIFYIFFYWKYIYQDYVLFTLINFLMKNGEKNKTFSFFFKSLFLLKKKIGMNPIFLIKVALLKRNWMIQLTKKQFNKKVFFFTRVLDFQQQIRQCVSKFLKAVNWLRLKKKISFWKSFFLLILNHNIIEKKKKKNFFDFNQKIDKWSFFFFKKLKWREMVFFKWKNILMNLKKFLSWFQEVFFYISCSKEIFDHFINFSYGFCFDWINFFFIKFVQFNFIKKRLWWILIHQKYYTKNFFYWLKFFFDFNQYMYFFLFFFKYWINFLLNFFYFFDFFKNSFIFEWFDNWYVFILNWKINFSVFFYCFLKQYLLNSFFINFFKKRILFLKNEKKNKKNYFHLKFILPEKFNTQEISKNKKFFINFKSFNKIKNEQQRNKRLHSFYNIRLRHRHLFLRTSKFGQSS